MAKVAYLLADINNVETATIKDLYERLESLSCTPVNSPSQ
jgi:D-3-phosphoglycerate dehydrogenase / 2-oxoglutarate reductase